MFTCQLFKQTYKQINAVLSIVSLHYRYTKSSDDHHGKIKMLKCDAFVSKMTQWPPALFGILSNRGRENESSLAMSE